MIGTKILTLGALATLVCAGVVVPAPAANYERLARQSDNDDDDDNNNNNNSNPNSNSNSQSNAACNTAIDASRANTNYCLDANIISQLNTCLATFSGDDDEAWEETYDDVLEAIGRTCGQTARPGAALTVLTSTQVATATPGATNTGVAGTPDDDDDDDDNNNVPASTTMASLTSTMTGAPTATGVSNNDDDDDDDNDDGNNTTLVSGTSTPTSTTVDGPAATSTGSQSNDNDDDDDDGDNVVPYDGAGSVVHAGIGGALAIVLVALAM